MMKKVFASLMAAALLLLAGAAVAGPATDVVRGKQQELFTIVAQPKTEKRQEKLRELFDEILHYRSFAKGSLGRKWKKLSKAQRKQFSKLLTTLVRCNYKRNLKKMLDYNIAYTSERKGSRGVWVDTVARHKTDEREPPIEISFRMKEIDDVWMAVDIDTEGASMTKTYKAQFLRILRKKGFDKLIEKMKKKIKKDGCE